MSLNTAHADHGVLIHAGECIILFSDNVTVEFYGNDTPEFKGAKTGRMYLTTHRMIYNSKSPSDAMRSFSFPFIALQDVTVEQPMFSANYIKGKVRAQPNGNFIGEVKFKLTFKSGGAIEYGQAMLKAAHLASRHMSPDAPPPPYTPPTGPWYAAPPPAYAPPPQGYYGWVPPYSAFPDQPPPNSVFVSNNPPPYPGVMGAGYPAGPGFSGMGGAAGPGAAAGTPTAPPGYPGGFGPPPPSGMSAAAVYSTKSIKPCVSAPTCSVHRHRPRPAPCPEPDKCYKKCIKRKHKCPSAMDTVTRAGSPCECAKVQSKDSRLSNKKTNRTHKKRLRKAYKQRSIESRWRRQGKCCVIL